MGLPITLMKERKTRECYITIQLRQLRQQPVETVFPVRAEFSMPENYQVVKPNREIGYRDLHDPCTQFAVPTGGSKILMRGQGLGSVLR